MLERLWVSARAHGLQFLLKVTDDHANLLEVNFDLVVAVGKLEHCLFHVVGLVFKLELEGCKGFLSNVLGYRFTSQRTVNDLLGQTLELGKSTLD